MFEKLKEYNVSPVPSTEEDLLACFLCPICSEAYVFGHVIVVDEEGKYYFDKVPATCSHCGLKGLPKPLLFEDEEEANENLLFIPRDSLFVLHPATIDFLYISDEGLGIVVYENALYRC